jgi:hypothetical protein
MTQLTLKTDIDENKLEELLRLLKSWDIEAMVTSNDVIKPKSDSNYEPFSKTRGMWKNRDIDARQLRREAWDGDNHYRK